MVAETLLLRQVHPQFMQRGRTTSQAFRPTPKDEKKLSVYDGDLISPEDSFRHYRRVLKFESVGVLGVTVGECGEQGLPVAPDPQTFAEHALIDFSEISNSQIEKKSKLLRDSAQKRGWLYEEPSPPC